VDLNLARVTITNDEEAQRFETSVDGLRAFIAYRRFPGRIVFTHTEVPPPLEGKGLAPPSSLPASVIFVLSRSVPMSPALSANTPSIAISFPRATFSVSSRPDLASHALSAPRSGSPNTGIHDPSFAYFRTPS